MIVAGVDGCRSGWIVVMRDLDGMQPPALTCIARFADLLSADAPHIIAVDMPIGLPDRAGSGGRGPERLVRPLLGQRQSSVFSVPSRAAVSCDDYRDACRIALETSDPPRKVSKQAFNLFPKIREIDALMTPEREDRIYEVHPEVAFWRLNANTPMTLPKKVKSRPSRDGLMERVEVLIAHGFDRDFLLQPPPRGAGQDDVIDACVNAVIAGRIAHEKAKPFPADPERDGKGLRMAIWA